MSHINVALEVFNTEREGLERVAKGLGESFNRAVQMILTSRGRVTVCGMGKSGIIGKKIAATLASTGTPAYFLHPGEAFHGDLGMVRPEDIFIGISYSGETEELVRLMPYLRGNGNKLIAITGNPDSTLSLGANSNLDVQVSKEACPLQLAPTSSTTATLVMGDALAVALMKHNDFQAKNFAVFHPGGSLGRRLLARVEDEMISSRLPFVSLSDKLLDVVSEITRGGCGIAVINERVGLGIITDGDVRRALEKYGEKSFSMTAEELMSFNPVTISPSSRVEDALSKMEKNAVESLLVINEGRVVGVFRQR